MESDDRRTTTRPKSESQVDTVTANSAASFLGYCETHGMLASTTHGISGRRGGTRTPDPWIRNPMLYPAELHALKAYFIESLKLVEHRFLLREF